MKIGILGCAGRMGRMLVTEVLATANCTLSGGVEPGGPVVGDDLGTLVGAKPVGASVTTDSEALFDASDAVIDFTIATATKMHISLAAATSTAFVIGTTGLSDDERVSYCNVTAAKKIAGGAGAQHERGRQRVDGPDGKTGERRWEANSTSRIVEMHHRYKVDAPSGTALGLGESAAKGRAVKLADVARRTRDGRTGARLQGRNRLR